MKKVDIRYKFTVSDIKSALFIVEELSRLDLLVLTCICNDTNRVRYTIYQDKKSRKVCVNCADLFTLSFTSFVDAVYSVFSDF